MFETFDYISLQQYWWAIVSLLGGLLVFLMFVQGGQTLTGMASNEEEKSLLINSIGRKWEFTFTTLVMFGGAMFAAFPKFYSVSFGGAYWIWMAVLFCFTIQAVSYEFRRKKGNFLGPRTYEMFLFINGSLGIFLIGVAIGTFYTGSEFRLDENNFVSWDSPLRGLEAVFNFQNVLLGLSVFFLSRILGALYFINNIDDQTLIIRSRKQVLHNAVLFLLTFLPFLIALFLKDGVVCEAESGTMMIDSYVYINSLLQMPLLMCIIVVGVIGVLTGVFISGFRDSNKGIWFSGAGTILTVFSMLILAGFNRVSFYPSTSDIQSSLTIVNSSSRQYTLTVMSYVSLLVPVVLAYIFYVWRAMDKRKIGRSEIKDGDHTY